MSRRNTRNNTQSKKVKKVNRKPSLFKRFFKILFAILSIYFISLVAFLGYIYFKYGGEPIGSPVVDNIISVVAPKLPEVTNVLVVGVDNDETRTDTIMIASYNSETNKASLISVPRDTLVKVPKDRWSTMTKNFPALSGNTSREVKINSIHSYGKKQGVDFLELQLEELLAIEINYYVKVNLEAFKYLVDSIGGIEFDVPQKMYYKDPTQDLYIDLKPGLQTLDGNKAEQLIRFRGYTSADLQRVKVQQDFIRAFLSTALSKDAIISNPTAYLNTLVKYIDTNFKISDAVKYLNVLTKFDIANFQTYTLPGIPKYINGVSYYVTDEMKNSDFVYEVFESSKILEEDIKKIPSYSKSIEVLNGSYISGMAKKTKEILEQDGFSVKNIGDSTYQKSENTKIYVSSLGMGKDLEKYFTNAKVIVNSSIVSERGYDIVVVIGTEEKFENVS